SEWPFARRAVHTAAIVPKISVYLGLGDEIVIDQGSSKLTIVNCLAVFEPGEGHERPPASDPQPEGFVIGDSDFAGFGVGQHQLCHRFDGINIADDADVRGGTHMPVGSLYRNRSLSNCQWRVCISRRAL